MTREEFNARMESVGEVKSYEGIREQLAGNSTGDTDIYTCMGELNELAIELTRHLRGKMHPDDFLQELSHVQWTVWRLQDMFGISDEKLRHAVQASFR